MLPFPVLIRPEDALRELTETNQKIMRGIETLSQIRSEDVQLGVTLKQEVYREDKLVLYRYTPMVEQPFETPLLIVYALVNRPYMVDLQEDRSLVRNLLKLGIDIYIMDWGYPGPEDRWITLDDYINGYINNCVDVVRERHGLDKINVLGICQGGTFSLCYSSLYPQKVKNLITTVTPVNFQVREGLLNVWAGCFSGPQTMDVDLMVDALGNVPGDFMNYGFLMLRPFLLNVRKYADLLDIMDDRDKIINFLRMEKWIFDSPDQTGEAFRQFLRDFYQGNKLIKGELEIGGKRVDLRNVRMPVLNVYAEEDHLVPPPSSQALKDYVGSDDYTERSFPVGHIGMYVSGKVQRDLPPTIAHWLKDRP
jgi:polyhydroxyalkanoate synthase